MSGATTTSENIQSPSANNQRGYRLERENSVTPQKTSMPSRVPNAAGITEAASLPNKSWLGVTGVASSGSRLNRSRSPTKLSAATAGVSATGMTQNTGIEKA